VSRKRGRRCLLGGLSASLLEFLVSRYARPALLTFVVVTLTVVLGAAAVSAVNGWWWALALCGVPAAYAAAFLVPVERFLRRESTGQRDLYGVLRVLAAANVPLGETRLFRRHGDEYFHTVQRRAGGFGGAWVVIQRFGRQDVSGVEEFVAGQAPRAVMTSTVFVLHPWYPVVSRRFDA
jgi:hypothetical protein